MSPSTDLVLGIDSSTQSTKAIAWDRAGTAVAEGRSPVAMSTPRPGHYEQHPEEWWRSFREALSQLWPAIDPARIAALAITNQRETILPARADGTAEHPAIVWLDERGRDEVAWLADKIGRARILELSGKPPDVIVPAYKLAWLLRHEPALYRRTAKFLEVHASLVWRLTGRSVTSSASADPTGLCDLQKRAWSAEILDALDLGPDRLPEIVPVGEVLGEVTAVAARETGLRAGTPVVAGAGDGQCASLGVDVTGPERANFVLGTAAVTGVYSATYRVGPAFRTMTSATGHGYILETCLRACSFLLNWFVERFGGGDSRDLRALFSALEAEAATLPVGSDGLLLVPYWSGCMTPYWDPDARGLIVGFSGRHGRAHVYRAIFEGVALEQQFAFEQVRRATGGDVQHFVLIGGGSVSPLWTQIVADVTGKPIRQAATPEATALGAGMLAATAAGWYPRVEDAAKAMTRTVGLVSPNPAVSPKYGELLAIYRELYPRLRDLFPRLVTLAGSSAPTSA